MHTQSCSRRNINSIGTEGAEKGKAQNFPIDSIVSCGRCTLILIYRLPKSSKDQNHVL